ncbi:MAG: hypothetical protein PHN49_08660 [Candidatus Omnitrophica bacterium]|nr:hypothetical protein [Candidatus Omnitrophota bacterium]MDD5671696.1 hypothetical protein [Candidatus Omnitrophota bacterium]
MNKKLGRGISVLLQLLLLSSLPAIAQETRRDVEYLKTEAREERQVAESAKKAKEKAALEGMKKLTFQDILKQPDDIAMNYAYARDQIARNDLLGASATLERILLINPNLHQVRALQGVVLFRLGALEDSRIAFDSLKEVKLPDSLRVEVDNYLRAIKRQKRRTHFSARETLGWGIDSNRNAVASSKTQLYRDVAYPIAAQNRARRDTHFLNITNLGASHDLGFQAGHEVFADFSYYLQEQTQVNSLDTQSFQYDLGGTYKSKWLNFTPMFYAYHVQLSDQTFLRSQGGRFYFDNTYWSKKLRPFIITSIERQDFNGVSESPDSYERTGPQFDQTGGFSYILTPTMRWTSSITYQNKCAKEKFDAYHNLKLENSHTWLLGKGQFLINTITAEFDRYKEADHDVVGRIRRDQVLSYRVTYGAPLTFFLIGKILPRPFQDITLSANYEYFRELANITNYSYTDHKFQILWTKRFDF